MRRLIDAVLVIHTIGGSIFVSSIFLAQLAASTKVAMLLLGIFISSGVFFLVVAYVDIIQRIRNDLSTRESDNTVAYLGSDQNEDGLNRTPEQQYKGDLYIMNFSSLKYLLFGIYSVWFLGGWLLAEWVS